MKNMTKRLTVLLALAVSVTFIPVTGATAVYAAEAVESDEETVAQEIQHEVLHENEIVGNTDAVIPEQSDFIVEENQSNDVHIKNTDISAEEMVSEEVPEEETVGLTVSASDSSAEKISINNATVTGVSDQICTGYEIKLPVVVQVDGQNLSENTDYSLSYKNNKNIGTAQVIITGVGDYEGTKTVSFKIVCDVPKIQPITNTESGFQLKWTTVPGAEKYRVYKKIENGAWVILTDTTSTAYLDRAVQSGVKYSYTVGCIKNDGTALCDYDKTGKTASYTITVPGGNISQVTSGIHNFTVSYSKVSGAKGYEVRYSLNPDMSGSTVKTLGENQTSLNVTSAEEGIYFVQVRAFKYDYVGNKIYGNWSGKRLAKYVRYNTGVSEATIESYISGVKSNQSIKAMLYAFSRIGYPYSQIKRSTGDYYDCSSLVWYAWDSAGIQLTSDWVGTAAAEAQALEGSTISYDQLMPGSLVFFSTANNGRYRNITHVVMYVGNGMVVEAANSRIGVVYRQLQLNGRGTVVVCADPINGGHWSKENGVWYYYKGDTKLKNSWVKDGAHWYWVDASGKMVSNRLLQIGGASYYFKSNGQMASNEWVKDSKGWIKVDSSGRVEKSRWVLSGSEWYYLKSNGYMAANEWVRYGSYWCWMNSSGKITRNTWIKNNNEWYFLKSNGYMASNEWVKSGSYWYWLESSGKMAKNKRISSGGSWYYLKSGGQMASGEWVKENAGWSWADGSGRIAKNYWLWSGSQWYYLKSNGYMASNEWVRYGTYWYWMNSSGKITRSQWVKVGNEWYYLKSNGYMASNEWTKDSKGWRWITGSGEIAKSKWIYTGRHWYYLNASGYMVTGSQKIAGKTYRFASSGAWLG